MDAQQQERGHWGLASIAASAAAVGVMLFLYMCWPVPPVLAVAALVFGIRGRRGTGRESALVGIVLAVLILLLYAFVGAIVLSAHDTGPVLPDDGEGLAP